MRKPKPFRTDVFSPVKLNLLIIKQLPHVAASPGLKMNFNLGNITVPLRR